LTLKGLDFVAPLIIELIFTLSSFKWPVTNTRNGISVIYPSQFVYSILLPFFSMI